MTDAVLIILVIVIIWLVMKRDKSAQKQVEVAASAPAEAKKAEGYSAQIAAALTEGFQASPVSEDIRKVADCACAGNSDVNYAVDEYGKNIGSYQQWIKDQGVSPDVQSNHSQWLAERQKINSTGSVYFTGRTMSVDSHDSYDPIPWIGLRRPEYVPVGNPTTVPDVDYELYKGNRQFCFRT